MPDYTLVPVDYQPDFSDYSLVPVDYDPFGEDGVTQHATPPDKSSDPDLGSASGVPASGQPNNPSAAPISAPAKPVLANRQQPGDISAPGPPSGDGSGQIVNLSARDILSSFAKGAANSVAQGGVNLLYGIGQVVSMGDLGKMAAGPPQVKPFSPTSNYFAAEGGTIAQGVTAVAGGVGFGRTLAGRTVVRAAQPNFGDLTNGDDFGPQYHDRVRQRALEDPVGHNFPPSYDSEILATDPILKPNNYTVFRQPGSLNGNDGVFEIGVNKDGVIDHRVFRRNK